MAKKAKLKNKTKIVGKLPVDETLLETLPCEENLYVENKTIRKNLGLSKNAKILMG